ncbi:MAG: hypothetical protein N3C13_00535 [Aquificaceae bacterium]|nr:hypothetical protein [Aquificaceae bacterium]MCX8059667.1 hypothetical protein [Aquificaceae bacterium]MDW8096722.1 hypothetical protein [Aquificaceae bacterium]
MKRILLLLPFLLSMAEPLKEQKFRVELEDKGGTKHSLRGLVCGGRAYLKVREGSVDYSLEFSSIRSIEVLSQEGQQMRVRVSFKNRSSKEYTLPSDLYCKGNALGGEAGFFLRDIRAIFITEEK